MEKDDIELQSDTLGDFIDYVEKKVFPPKNCGSRSFIPLMLFEELDATIRYTIFVAAFTGLFLYNYEWAQKELPLVYCGLTFVTVFSNMSYLGGLVSFAVSFIFGSLVGICIVIILTYCSGRSYDFVTYQQPTGNFTCIYSPITQTYNSVPITFPVQGDVGDPDPVILGFLLFIATFLLLHFSRSLPWSRGAVVTLNLYSAIWYLGMVDITVPVPDEISFLKFLRTTVLALGFFCVCLLLPLPKLFPTFIPQPRLSASTIFVALGSCQASFAGVCSDLLCNFRRIVLDPSIDDKQFSKKKKAKYEAYTTYQHAASMPIGTRVYIMEKLDAITETILKLNTLYELSAKWEAMWWTLPFPHCISGQNILQYLSRFKVAVTHTKMMVRALDNLCHNTDNEGNITPDNAEHLNRLLAESEEYIQHSYKRKQNFERCCSKGNIIGCCNEGSYLGIYDDDTQFAELCDEIEKLLERENSFSFGTLFDQIGEEHHNPSKQTKLSTSLPSIFPRHFFVMNYLVILRLTRSLEALCQGIIDDRMANEEIVSRGFVRNFVSHIIEYPIRLSTWFTSYVTDLISDIKSLLYFFRTRNPRVKFAIFTFATLRSILSSFIISISISVAFLFLFIEYFRDHVPSSITIIVTIVTAVEPDNPGTAITRSMFRLAGTSIGVSLSFLLLALFDSSKNAVFGGGIIFAFVGRFLMGQQEKYSECALNFLITSWIILYSGTLDLPNPQLLLATIAARGISASIGIVIAFGALFLWPINPNMQLRYNSLKLLCVSASKSIRKTLLGTEEVRNPFVFYSHWLAKFNKRAKDIALQSELAIEAREELHVFTDYTFVYHDYTRFINLQKQLIGDTLWLEIIFYYIRRGMVKGISEEYEEAKLRLSSAIHFCLEEIGEKIFSESKSPFLVHFHLRRAFQEHAETVKRLVGDAHHKMSNRLIVQFHSLIYTFALLFDTITKLDRKAELIAAKNRARKGAGIPLCL